MRTLICLLVFVFFLKISQTFTTVVGWGEICQFTAECGDHRLVCEEIIIKNITTKLCVCDRYHEWNGTLVGCVQKYNTTHILALLEEKYNVSSRIEYEANIVFLAQVVAGLIVLGVGIVCSLVVVAYCLRMWKQDLELEDILKRLESQKENNKASTSRRNK